MGIDITRRATFNGSAEDILKRLARYFHGRRIHFHQTAENEWRAGLLYREGIFFDLTGLEVSARTNLSGPGYHDYVISLLDEMRYKTGLSWVDSDDEEPDETGYWRHRDFKELQISHAGWLRLLLQYILDSNPDDLGPSQRLDYRVPGVVCMSPDILPLGPQFVSLPLGPKSREELESLKDDPARFFIWWEKSVPPSFFRRSWRHPASFYLKYALSYMWQDHNWLPPATDEERQLIDSTLRYLDLAWNLDPGLEYPAAEWRELAELIDDALLLETLDDRFPGPPAERPPIGYLRGRVEAAFGSWRLILSGNMHRQKEEDGTAVWWNDEMMLRIKVSPLIHKESGRKLTPEELFENLREAFGGHRDFRLKNAPGVRAAIRHYTNDKPYTSLLAAAGDTALLLMIFYREPSGRGAADEICAGLAVSRAADNDL